MWGKREASTRSQWRYPDANWSAAEPPPLSLSSKLCAALGPSGNATDFRLAGRILSCQTEGKLLSSITRSPTTPSTIDRGNHGVTPIAAAAHLQPAAFCRFLECPQVRPSRRQQEHEACSMHKELRGQGHPGRRDGDSRRHQG